MEIGDSKPYVFGIAPYEYDLLDDKHLLVTATAKGGRSCFLPRPAWLLNNGDAI